MSGRASGSIPAPRATEAELAELLRSASRTFAVGIEALPDELREAVRVAYLLLRISDYFEDDVVLTPSEKAEALQVWEGVLAGERTPAELAQRIGEPSSQTPDAEVARTWKAVLDALATLPPATREVVTEYVRLSTRGMRRWVERGPRIDSEADLDDYMFQVAGLVGLLLTDLFARHSPALKHRHELLAPLAVEFGLGLQTVNVIRGLSKDIERGWIYIPTAWASELGVTREELFATENGAAGMRALDRLVEKAERHLEGARRFVRLIPRRERGIRIFCILPLLFAVRTLALSRANPAVFHSEVKMSREEVLGIVRATRIWGWSNLWLELTSRRLRRR